VTGPIATEPCTLERRYRRLLRLLPRPYRQAREQEMVDTFLDSEFQADPDNADLTAKYGGVGWREAASVVALALRLRWADPMGPERYRVRLAALRISVIAVLTMLACWAVTLLIGLFWTAVWPPNPGGGSPARGPDVGTATQAWMLANRWAFVLWIPALVLAVHGGRRGTWWAVACAAVPALTSLASTALHPIFSAGNWTTTVVQLAVPVGLAALAVAGVSPTVPHLRGWLIAAGVMLIVISGAGLWVSLAASHGGSVDWLLPVGWFLVDEIGGWSIAAVTVGVVFVLRWIRGRGVRTASLLGLTWFAAAVTVARAGRAIDWSPLLSSRWSVYPESATAGVLVQLVVAAAITVTAGTVAARRIRRLPAVRYPVAGRTGPPATA
jgi:hypothetical protein